MFVERNILKMKRWEDVSNLDRTIVIVPDQLVGQVIREFHGRGHFGEKKLRLTLLQHVWFPELSRRVRNEIAACEACQERKGPSREYKLELKSQAAGFFNEKVIIDLITMRPSPRGFTRGLSVVDVWSGYGACIPLKGGTTKEVARGLIDGWITQHSMMNEIQSDRGPEFASELMRELCKKLEIVKIESAPWSPFSAGKCEKFNRTVKDVLAKELGGESNAWDELLPTVCFYYNISENLTTNISPFELATGRLPVLPVSLTLDQRPERKLPNDYINEVMDKMTGVARAVFENTRRNQATQQREFNKKIHGKPLEVGDLVRVRYHGPPPRGITMKLISRWRGPFPIVEKIGDRTYVVEMPYRGKMAPRVQNIRNLWKVGRLASADEEPMGESEGEGLGVDEPWRETSGEDRKTEDRDDNKWDGTEHIDEDGAEYVAPTADTIVESGGVERAETGVAIAKDGNITVAEDSEGPIAGREVAGDNVVPVDGPDTERASVQGRAAEDRTTAVVGSGSQWAAIAEDSPSKTTRSGRNVRAPRRLIDEM